MTNVIAEVEKMRIVGPVAAEFREEAATTRRVLERVPADKLAWRPHPKSMSLGQLALHIATTPGRLAAVVRKPEHEFNPAGNKIEEARGTAEILAAFDQSVKDAGTYLDGLSEEDARAPFTLKVGGRCPTCNCTLRSDFRRSRYWPRSRFSLFQISARQLGLG